MRRWIKGILYAVMALIVLGAGFYYYLFHLHGLENIATSRLNKLLAGTIPLEVSIGHIGGDLLSTLVLENVSVRFHDSLASYQVFGARRISSRYSLRDLLHANYSVNFLSIDSALIHLKRDSAGSWLFPRLPQDTGKAAPKNFPDFAIGQLHVNQCGVLIDGPSDTLALDGLNFVGAVKGEQGTVAVDIHQANTGSNKKTYRVSQLMGKITFSNGQITAQDLSVARDSTRIKVSGVYDLDHRRGKVAFNMDNVDVGEVGELAGVRLSGEIDAYGNLTLAPDTLSGTVSLGGQFLIADFENLTASFILAHGRLALDTLYGTILGNCGVEGSGQIDFATRPERYSVDLALNGFDLSQLIKHSFKSKLNGQIHLDGRSFANESLALTIDAHLFESEFDGYPIQSGSGRMIITTDSITFPQPFIVSYYENQFAVTGKIDYRNDLNLDVLAHLNNLDRYRGKLFIDQPGGRGYAQAHLGGRTSDPDLKGYFTSDSLWLYGMYADSFDATFDIDRFLTGRRGSVIARGMGGKLWNVPYDTVFAVLGLDSTVVHMDSVLILSPRSNVFGRGSFDYSTFPELVRIDTMRLTVYDQVLYNKGKMLVQVDSSGFNFTKAAIGSAGSMLMALGRLNFDETMNLALSVNDVPIKTWARLYREDFPSDGRASFQADVSGSFKDPSFKIYGSIDSLYYHDLLLGDVQYAGTYASHTCAVDSVVLFSHPGIYHATGQFSADVDFTADTLARLLDQPFDVNIVARDTMFNLVTLFLPEVEHMGGIFSADFRLFGTPSTPHLEGLASLTKGSLKYFDLADTLFTDSASVTMKDNQILIDGITTYVKDSRREGGRSEALIEGAITVKSLDNLNYDLEVNIPKDLPIHYDLADISMVVSGKLKIEGDTPPTVTGDLTVLGAQYRVNFAAADEGSPLMELLSGDHTWDVNMNLDIVSNYWIKNDDIDAEFSGQMNLIRDKGVYSYIGQLDIIRGRAYWLDKTFNNLSGTISFDNTSELNPTLDITGYTRIAGFNPTDTGTQTSQEIGVHVTGTLENPDINTVVPVGATDQTIYSREELLPMLLADYTPNDPTGTKEITKLGMRLQGVVGQQVSQIGARELKRVPKLGVETFDIDPYYGGKLDPLKTSVTVGGYSGNLYWYGRTDLSYGFEYRFNRNVLLEGQRDQDLLYHLDLKLHWEF